MTTPSGTPIQHPCDQCGSLTDEDELQVPPHLGEDGDEFWCAECIHSHDPETKDPDDEEDDE